MATLKKSEMDALVRNTVVERLNLDEIATQIGASTYAIPVETDEGTFYAKVAITAAQRKATKTTEAFDLETAVAKYAADLAEKAEKEAEREAAKAAKAAKAKKD